MNLLDWMMNNNLNPRNLGPPSKSVVSRNDGVTISLKDCALYEEDTPVGDYKATDMPEFCKCGEDLKSEYTVREVPEDLMDCARCDLPATALITSTGDCMCRCDECLEYTLAKKRESAVRLWNDRQKEIKRAVEEEPMDCSRCGFEAEVTNISEVEPATITPWHCRCLNMNCLEPAVRAGSREVLIKAWNQRQESRDRGKA